MSNSFKVASRTNLLQGVPHNDTKLLSLSKVATPKAVAPPRAPKISGPVKMAAMPMQPNIKAPGASLPNAPRVKQITPRIWPLKRQQIRTAGLKPPKNDQGDLE